MGHNETPTKGTAMNLKTLVYCFAAIAYGDTPKAKDHLPKK